MELSIKQAEDDSVSISAAGRITQLRISSNESDPLSELLGGDAYTRDVLLDLKSTDFMDSSGVNWLIRSHKRFKENGRRMVVHSVPPVVRNVIRVMRLDLLIEMADDEAEAIKKIQNEATK